MAIITRRKGPLPDNHPLKGGLIIFGDPRPKRTEKPIEPAEHGKSGEYVENSNGQIEGGSTNKDPDHG